MEKAQAKPDVRASEDERDARAIDFLSSIRLIVKNNACPERDRCEEPVCLYCYREQQAYANG